MRSLALWFVIIVTAGGCGGSGGPADPGSPAPDAAGERVIEVSERDAPSR